MARGFHLWLALVVSTVLALPQGWCCLVMSLGSRPAELPRSGDVETRPCCSGGHADRPANKSCCPREGPHQGTRPPADKCALCAAASVKPPVKQTGLDDLPVLSVPLPVLAAPAPSTLDVRAAFPLRETGPPLHLFLCVWRC